MFKNYLISVGTGLAAVISLSLSSVHAAEPKPSTLNELRGLALKCGIQPYWINPSTGQKVYGRIKSICPELLLLSSGPQTAPNRARIIFHNQSVFVRLTDSVNSDGGDLNDLEFTDAQGRRLATRSNILAFGDIVAALAGGEGPFREEFQRQPPQPQERLNYNPRAQRAPRSAYPH